MLRELKSPRTAERPITASVILNSGVPIRRSPASLARRFAQICLAVVAESLAGEDLTPLQYGALAYLNDEPHIDQNGLAARLGIEQSHSSLLVEQLVSLELVERRINGADRRARQISLTAKGTKLYRRLRLAAQSRRDRMLTPLTTAERQVLLDFLVRIVKANEAYARPGAGRRKRRPHPSPSGMT